MTSSPTLVLLAALVTMSGACGGSGSDSDCFDCQPEQNDAGASGDSGPANCEPNSLEGVADCTGSITGAAAASYEQRCSADGTEILDGPCTLEDCIAGFTVSGNTCIPDPSEPDCESDATDCWYVSPAGTGSECTFDNPCSLLTGRDKLAGGDTLYLRGGTYSQSYLFTEGAYGDYQMILGFGRNHSFQMPAPSAQARVNIRAVPGETATLDGGYSIATGTGAHCVYIDQSFITVSNLVFSNCRVPIGIGENNPAAPSVAVVVEGNLFTGDLFVADNSGSVEVSYHSIDTVVHNNRLIGPGKDVGSLNSSGIYVIMNRGTKILNNEISQYRVGIHYKHEFYPDIGDTGHEIFGNHIFEVSRAGRLNNRHTHIHHNIFGRNSGPLQINHCSGGEGGDYNFIEHNFIESLWLDGCSSSKLPVGAVGNTIANNIIEAQAHYHPWQDVDHESTLVNNLYVQDDIRSMNSGYDSSTWPSSGAETNAIFATPVYADAQHNQVSDYALQPMSPGYQQGSDGTDVGPDTTLVGLQ